MNSNTRRAPGRARLEPDPATSELVAGEAADEGRSDRGGAPRRAAPPRAEGLRVIRLLGVGASSSVWLARVIGDGPRWAGEAPGADTVAIKVAHRTDVASEGEPDADGGRTRGPADRRQLDAELQAMRRVRHGHLVTAYGWTETSCGPGLLLEPFTAGSLARILAARGTLSLGETVTVLGPVAQAVAHLHRGGVAHGDVSPGNVLLAPDGRPALADLGEAQLLGATRGTALTAGFAAPERLQAARDTRGETATRAWEASLAPECDVYSLAAVAWYVLTGAPPGPARSRPPLGTLVPEAPARLIQLLEDALTSAPEARPSAAEFAAGLHRSAPAQGLDLAAHVDDDVLPELPTVRPGAGSPSSAPRRRRRILMGLSAGVLLVAAGGIAHGGALDRQGTGAESAQETAQDAGRDTAQAPQQPRSGQEDGHAAPDEIGGEGQEVDLARAAELMDQDDPLLALDGLIALRTAALRDPEQAELTDYVASGSPAETSEADLLRRLVASGQAYDGASMEIRPMGEPTADEDTPDGEDGDEQVAIPAEVTMDAFDGSDDEAQRVRLVLSRVDGSWRLHAVQELPSSP